MSVLTPTSPAVPAARLRTGTRTAPTTATRRPAPGLPAQDDLRRFEALLAALPLAPAVLVDVPGRRLLVDGADVDLTRQEFDLVAYLAGSAGRVVSRDELYAGAWHTQDLSAGTRTVDVHVRRVRAKSGLDGLITTVRGVGYRLNALDGLRVAG
jgi:DNA-binding response OmpR family regulator